MSVVLCRSSNKKKMNQHKSVIKITINEIGYTNCKYFTSMQRPASQFTYLARFCLAPKIFSLPVITPFTIKPLSQFYGDYNVRCPVPLFKQKK